ncbi:MAG: helix-turn-helix domain-containing protein [Candidatus Marinimicrobia bacterium]|nr:helix-turn-helix domain-containing protein [Candidatus Neomarinimicrobiota bacterium]
MSRNNLQFVNNILDRIKEYYSIKTDIELANFLNVHRSTISAWRHRGVMDYELVLKRCTDPDLNWLIYGENLNHQSYHIINQQKNVHEVTNVLNASENIESLKSLLNEYRKITQAMRELLTHLPE